MATTASFKEYERQPRVMTVEDLFNFGMSYVDSPLAEGYAKLLVNFDLKNQGTSLAPRGGLKAVTSNLSDTTLSSLDNYTIHHVGTTMVQSIDGQDASVHKYIMVAQVVQFPGNPDPLYSFENAKIFLETDAGFLVAPCTLARYSKTKVKMKNIHRIDLETLLQCNRGIFVSIEANTYIPTFDGNFGNMKFMRLELKFTSDVAFTAAFVELVPKEVSAAQVVNSGYNMMKADPYEFANTQNATGALVLGGVIPKDTAGNIKLTADVGEALVYYLNYTYPASDATKKYMAQWEINDTSTGNTTQVLQQVRKSLVYDPGMAIALPITVPYKQYTIVVKMYYADVVAAHTYVSDEDDAKTLTPIKTITVSSYFTAAGVAGNATNLTARKYNMASCSDMCTWQQRSVIWGVANAPTTLFTSQANLPEYVPYPNNVEVFPEDIVRCVPFLTYLLVFTKTKLYQLSQNTDGVNTYFVTKCIQERLIMTEEDAATVHTVKNMVYFKSGNYFYMIVPNNNAGAGELQLAPVSRPIEFLLDNFSEAVQRIVDEVYNVDYAFDLKEGAGDNYTIKFVDYNNYLDGSIMRNVYKLRVDITKDSTTVDTRYIDFTLNYDTTLRAWSTYMHESTQYRMTVYESNVTSGTTFVTSKDVEGFTGVRLQLCKLDTTSPADELPLTTGARPRVFKNYQLLNTGYRAHFDAYKKRFREVQFTVNNTQQDSLNFYTSFVVDDDVRKSLFKYTTMQVTDPSSSDYGLIYVEREIEDALEVAGAIKLGEGDGWILDFSLFPTLTVSKVRHRVSGKGYLGKLKILSKNERLYELLGTNWVYRKMNGR